MEHTVVTSKRVDIDSNQRASKAVESTRHECDEKHRLTWFALHFSCLHFLLIFAIVSSLSCFNWELGTVALNP